MVNNLLKYSLIFIVSVLLQVLVLNHILIFRMISPFYYLIFLLLLPYDTPRAMLIFLGFILGLSIDAFTNTLGVHAAVFAFSVSRLIQSQSWRISCAALPDGAYSVVPCPAA